MVYRIIGKAILSVVKFDVLEVAGYLQLCAGQQAGAEAAVHALCTFFECQTLEVVFVDAKNAFNCLNRRYDSRQPSEHGHVCHENHAIHSPPSQSQS